MLLYYKSMENNSEKLIGIEEVSRLLGVCQGTLRYWDRTGQFVPVRTAGKHRRYRLSDIIKIQAGEFFDKDK